MTWPDPKLLCISALSRSKRARDQKSENPKRLSFPSVYNFRPALRLPRLSRNKAYNMHIYLNNSLFCLFI